MNTNIPHSVKLAQNLSSFDPTPDGSTMTTLASSLLNRAPYILGGLALAALIYSGFMYMTAYGDTAKMEQAKKNITGVIIGIIAIASVSIIIKIILTVISATKITNIT